MRGEPGTFRRIASLIIDFIIILSVVFTVFRIFVEPNIQEFSGYHEGLTDWTQQAEVFNEEMDRLDERLDEGDRYREEDLENELSYWREAIRSYSSEEDERSFEEIVAAYEAAKAEGRERLEEGDRFRREDYDLQRDLLVADYEEYDAVVVYLMSSILFHYGGWVVVNYLYQGLTKGRTFGRKWTNLELRGPINWWTLFIREVLWKGVFWGFTFTIGIWVDFALISFSKDKRTIRDHISEVRVVKEDAIYPI